MWRASFITKESNEFLWRCVMQNPRSRRCGYISDIIADSGFYIFPVSKIEFQSELSMTCIFYIFFEKNKKFCLHFFGNMVLYFLCYETRGCSSMVEHQPSKLDTWVRFPSPAFFVTQKQNIGDYLFIKNV